MFLAHENVLSATKCERNSDRNPGIKYEGLRTIDSVVRGEISFIVACRFHRKITPDYKRP